jgi:hypothetical protein
LQLFFSLTLGILNPLLWVFFDSQWRIGVVSMLEILPVMVVILAAALIAFVRWP